MMRLGLLLALTVSLFWAVSVTAADGVLEINQTCAAGPGCFPGDTPGFPIQIGAPGSYRLTGSLSVPALQNGVAVSANDVTLDLGGFELAGALTCTGEGATLSCPGWIAAATRGVDTAADNVVVRDGVVRGFSRGLNLLGGVFAVERLRITQNGELGISAGVASRILVVESTLERNGGDDPAAPAAAAHGADVTSALILRSVFRANGGNGILVRGPTLAIDDNFVSNGGDGFLCNGIRCAVLGSTVQGNAAAGLATTFASSLFYGENVITSNPVAAVTGPGNETQMGTNICDTDTTCP